MFHHTGALQVLQKLPPHMGGTAGPTAHDQWLAKPLLQAPHAQRHGRRRDVQRRSSLLKTTRLRHGQECLTLF